MGNPTARLGKVYNPPIAIPELLLSVWKLGTIRVGMPIVSRSFEVTWLAAVIVESRTERTGKLSVVSCRW
jgi:hypothetical protein